MDRIGYIKDHVGGDLSFQPDLQREVARTLLSLLKARNTEDYSIQSILLLSRLEEKARKLDWIKGERGEESSGFVTLHETKKAASVVFPELTDEEAAEVKLYLEGFIPKQEETLEQYMSQELGLDSRDPYDPDRVSGSGPKMAMAALTMFNSGNLEDFELNPPEPIPGSRIEEVITKYYGDRRYIVNPEGSGMFTLKSEKQTLGVNVSNYGDRILVSVLNLSG